MKKIILLSIAIIYSVSVKCQQTILNDGVSIKLPNSTQKVSKEQALNYAGKKFNNDKYVIKNITDGNAQHLYKTDKVLIHIVTLDTLYKFKKDRILKLKKGLDEFYLQDKTYTSIIKNANNYAVLITNYKVGNIGYYNFFCYNNRYTRVVNGTLEFNTSDTDEATTILNNLLTSIKFKD